MLILTALMMLQPAARAAAPVSPMGLAEIKTVYLLPMSNGFDQYLATHLVRSGAFQVVTDPAKADAIFTDRVGKPFETKMEDLYPTPKPEPAPETAKKDEDEAKDAKPGTPSFDLKSQPVERVTSFGKGKGTLFLVGRYSRIVLWSIYERPRSVRPDDLDKAARDVVRRLESAQGGRGVSSR